MAVDDKPSEGKKKGVVSFFRRALSEVVDFPKELKKSREDSKDESLSRPPEKDKYISEKDDAVPPLHKKELRQNGFHLGRFVSRCERKESQSTTVIKPESGTNTPIIKQAPIEKPKYAARNKKFAGLKIGFDKLENPMKKRLITATAVVCISIVTACSFLGEGEPEPKIVDETPMYIRISSGMGAASIGEYLEEKQVISSQKFF